MHISLESLYISTRFYSFSALNLCMFTSEILTYISPPNTTVLYMN